MTADTVYAGAYAMLRSLEDLWQPFVLAVPCTQRIGLSDMAAGATASWPETAWQRL